MKITNIEMFQLDVPYHERIRDRMEGAIGSQVCIYKVHTDEGITGVGEGANHQAQIPQYIGKSPFEFMMGDSPVPFQQAFYDVMGKALELPAYKLFGQKVRDRVSIGYWSLDMPPERWAQEAKVASESGFKLHKIKARPWYDIIEQVASISEVVPSDYQLRVDANGTFDQPSVAVSVARKLEGYNIESFETPIPQENVDGYVFLRGKIDIPITIHMGTPPPVQAIKAGMNDSFIIAYPDARVANTLREATIADAAGGMPVWLQVVGLGITTAYVIHLSAVIRNATMPAITLSCLREDDLIKDGIEMKEGYAEVPEAPGLGVELDEEALDKYRVK